MGCPSPVPKDIDLLFLTQHGMPAETKRQMAELVLAWSAVARPLEIHFLSRENLSPWRYPTPYDFHYSEEWRGRISEQLTSGEWRTWNDQQPVDPDLAAHLTITSAPGDNPVWPASRRIDPANPPRRLSRFHMTDVANVAELIEENPVYGVLNLCRVAWYVEARKIASKEEAGVWASQSGP